MTRHIVLAVGLLAATACQVDRASEAVECNSSGGCDDPSRECIEGWCVLLFDAGNGIDGGSEDGGGADAEGNCPDPCTSCNGSVCTVDCAMTDCDVAIVCPANFDCQVLCGTNDCGAGIDCSASTSCSVTCENNACDGPISCSIGGRCSVLCSGNNSCKGAIDCSQSCTCLTDCGSQACNGDPFVCPFLGCQTNGQCSDEPAVDCDMCQ